MSEGVGVIAADVDASGVVARALVDVMKESVSSLVARIESATLLVEGAVTVGCTVAIETSVVSDEVVNVGVTSTEIELDSSTKLEVGSIAEEGSELGVSEGVGVIAADVDASGVVARPLVDVMKESVSSLVARIESATLLVEGAVTVGCTVADETSVVSDEVVNVGVTSTEIELDSSTKLEVGSIAEEGSGITKLEVLTPADVDGGGDATKLEVLIMSVADSEGI